MGDWNIEVESDRLFVKKCFSPSRLLLCLFFLFGSQTTHAQYRFDHWTTENGLPQNSVRSILQARDGYIWLTTFDGLARFDGVRFTVFNKNNSPGMSGNRLLQIFEDRFGDLWIRLESGGLLRRHQGRFTTYTREQGLPAIAVQQLMDDGQGNLIFAWGGELFRWWDGGFQPVEQPVSSATQPPDEGRDNVSPVYFWRDSGKWFCLVNGQKHSWTETELPISDGNFFALTDDRGQIWVSTPQTLIHIRDGCVARVYSERDGLPGKNPRLVAGKREPFQAISRDTAGRLWLTNLNSMQSELMSLQAPEGLNGNGAYADNEGNYWFGDHYSGLFRARKQTITPYAKAEGLNVKEVYPILEARDGSIWIGTLGDGLVRLKEGSFTSYLPKGSIVSSLYEDRAGQLWFNGTLRLMDGRPVQESWGQSPPKWELTTAQTMCEDAAGAYWIGTPFGVARFMNGVMTYYTTKDGLAGNDTRVIINDMAGGVWIGSYGGLTHYEDGKLTAWTEKDGLPGNMVRALKQDGDGSLWIGTYDSGLGRFKDGRFTRYTTHQGMFDNGVFVILEDDYGWLWMSCNRGIYRARKQELNDFADGRVKTITCVSYNKSDGMPSSECNGGVWPAGIKTRDGKLWFPTMGGVAVIDPASIKINTQPPPVVLEEMRINNETVPYEVWNSASHNPQSAIQVLPGKDNFEIEYTALSFINSANLRFRYKLEGADRDWVEAGTRRTAYYSHVLPGEYTFRVIAANADGVWNDVGASIRVTVIPPFWRTWWFTPLVWLGIAAVIGAAWRYRAAQLRLIQVAQETFTRRLIASQEAERKRIAGELHDGLGQSLVIIRNWALLGSGQLNTDSPAKEELNEITATASRAINEVREIAYNLGPYHLERLGLANTIQDMVKRVSQSSGVNVTAELDPLDGAVSRETEMSLYRITQEALNNMVKHSQATEARVSLKHEAAGLRLTITDNGKGFSPQNVASTDGTSTSQTGFGLTGMVERVRLIGGALTIRSAPGQGTTIEAVLGQRGSQDE
jgi:signal transduction histidine kinase/ligand-binding sensor domain-containing protein